MYYVFFSLFVYALLTIMGIASTLEYMRKTKKANAVCAVDKASLYVFLVVILIYFAFLVDGYYSYFNQYGNDVKAGIPTVCYSFVLYWLSFYFLFSQNVVAYNDTLLFVGSRCLNINELSVYKVVYAPLNRMYIYVEGYQRVKYVLRLSKDNGEKLLAHIERVKSDIHSD